MCCIRLKNCCCCVSLDSGSRLVAILGLVLGTGGLAWAAAGGQTVEAVLMAAGTAVRWEFQEDDGQSVLLTLFCYTGVSLSSLQLNKLTLLISHY